jgi:hypothetical protein
MDTKNKKNKNKSTSAKAMKDLSIRKEQANKVQGGALPTPGPEDFPH